LIKRDPELGTRQPNILKNKWILSRYQEGLELIEPVVNNSEETDTSVTFEPEDQDVPNLHRNDKV